MSDLRNHGKAVILSLFQCDHCGCEYTSFEMAETIEEMLCEQCASGITSEDEGIFDGQEHGYDHDYDYPENDPEITGEFTAHCEPIGKLPPLEYPDD